MGCISLAEYAAAVTDLVAAGLEPQSLVDAIAKLKRELLENRDLVPDICYEGLDKVPYTRNLLYEDPEGRFVVLALVWASHRESPVHDHASWGVVGTFAEKIEVTDFLPPPEHGGRLSERQKQILEAGDVVTIVPPRHLNLHKMANPFEVPAVSIHTYGDRALACRAYNPANGDSAEVLLRLHHVV